MAKMVRIGEKKILRDAEQALFTLTQELKRSNGATKRPREEEHGQPGKKQRAS
jgi:SET domain-containing protein 6